MSGQRIIHPLRHTNGKVKGENGKVNRRSTPEGAEVKGLKSSLER